MSRGLIRRAIFVNAACQCWHWLTGEQGDAKLFGLAGAHITATPGQTEHSPRGEFMSDQSSVQDLLLSPERDADPLIGRVIDNRYRVLSLIAVGGMGRVYRAEQTSLGRAVAIKILALPQDMAALDPQYRERFALEAATASRLANPNTVTIFDYGRTDDGLFYLVMEFVEGITLSRLLKTEKRLVAERALQIARQVCHSLVEAHARGIIHRDIKPANILLLYPDLEWVKVLDFGIAKFVTDQSSTDLDEQLTRVGSYVGTPEYMAPESFYSRVDARADIYSIGVMLYLMLSGRVPLQGATHTATIVMAVHDAVPRMDPTLGVPPTVETVVMRCLAKKPEERFQTMAEVLNAIASCLVDMGAALRSPTHPTVTGTGVKPALELTLKPGAGDGEQDRPRVMGTKEWLLAGVVMVVVALTSALVVTRLGNSSADVVAPQAAPVAPASVEPPRDPVPPGSVSPGIVPGPISAELAAAEKAALEKAALERAALEKATADKAALEKAAAEKAALEKAAAEKAALEKVAAEKLAAEKLAAEKAAAKAAEKVQSRTSSPSDSAARSSGKRKRDVVPAPTPEKSAIPEGYKPSPY